MTVHNVFGPVDIAVSGMRAQGQHMEVISSNIANARTADAGQGQPYRRLETILRAQTEGVSPVVVDEVLPDQSPLQSIYDPGNPLADASGYRRHAQRPPAGGDDEPDDCQPILPGQCGHPETIPEDGGDHAGVAPLVEGN